MNQFRFISFLLLFAFGTAITVFNSCSDKDDDPIDKNDQPATDLDKPDTYSVSGISLLGDHELSLAVDSSYTFSTTVWPEYATDKTITWTSSDLAIVSVSDEGTIKANAVGNTLITAQSGNNIDTCRVTVTRATTSISLNNPPRTIYIDDETYIIVADLLPLDATDVVIWESTEANSNKASEAIIISSTGKKTAKLTAFSTGSATITAKAGSKTITCTVTALYNAATDRGVIINGTKWATRNVEKPNEFTTTLTASGLFYQWNHNAGWSITDPMSSNDDSAWDNTLPAGNTWETTKNVCPEGWRIPTKEEMESLLNAGSQWTTISNKTGRKFGSGDNSVFLPAVGSRGSNGTLYSGTYGNYWSSTLSQSNAETAYYLNFSQSNTDTKINDASQSSGFSIRCVEDTSEE